jgi:hypothetical protein
MFFGAEKMNESDIEIRKGAENSIHKYLIRTPLLDVYVDEISIDTDYHYNFLHGCVDGDIILTTYVSDKTIDRLKKEICRVNILP